MAVYSYYIAWAHEKERLYEPTTLVEQTMQRKGSKHILSKGLSAVHLNISFKHTSKREMSELVRLKTVVTISTLLRRLIYTFVNL